MKRLLLVVCCGAAFATCGPPVAPECCQLTGAARGTPYSGTISGTGTTVTVEMAANGNTTITFVNGTHRVTEGFTGALTTP
jgi:hypothetical protein